MATASDLRRMALALDGVTAAPHFDRTAFKVDRIFATLAPDERTANLKLAPDEQALKCEVAAEAFVSVPNAWGAQGWTLVTLASLPVGELAVVLALAHAHAVGSKKPCAKG